MNNKFSLDADLHEIILLLELVKGKDYRWVKNAGISHLNVAKKYLDTLIDEIDE